MEVLNDIVFQVDMDTLLARLHIELFLTIGLFVLRL